MRKNRLKSLRVQNLLSFGADSPEVELGDLNVLIGPNGSGKSNLIEIIGLLRSAPKDFSEEVADSGGVSELLWKGKPKAKSVIATLEVRADPIGVKRTLLYRLSFTRAGTQIKIVDEKIENEKPDEGHDRPYLYFDYNGGRPVLNVAGQPRSLKHEEVDPQRSILSQRQDPDQYPEVTYLGRFFGSFRLYRNWDFGPDSEVRNLYGSEQKNDFLEEDISNLGLMLNRLRADPNAKPELLRHLKMFYQGAEDILTPIQGGLVDVRVEEENGITIPASRLSDGTLRWLSLLTILLHPDPPPLVCIEEPELGLHPDMIQPLAKLLVSASERMQLIVTTHSDGLVDELSGNPSAVIVCEKRNASSMLKRLNSEQLTDWLKRYTLGQLWRTGEIGGNRW
ncbi:MAG: AAA family ATPase [Candidatus Korobacteraceae bacterium]